MRIALLLIFLVTLNHLTAQQIGVPAPSLDQATIPYANYHQKWTPMMQKLFQQVRDDDGIVTHYVGSEVGTPYEAEDFKKGNVWYENENLGEYFYRYNIFSKEIELKRTSLEEERQQALIRDPKVTLISAIADKVYRYTGFTSAKNEYEEGYLILIFKGTTCSLYKYLESKFNEAKPAANSMVNPIPSKFTTFTTYFLQKEEGEISAISQKKGKFLKGLDNSMAQNVKEYLKQEKIDLSDESDLIRTIAYIDQIDFP